MPVASGNIEEHRIRLLQLADRRTEIENEIEQLTGILTRNGVGMNDRLTDENDFPRSDIDVYQVRHARHRIICLQNDHKALMKQIEEGLYSLHSEAGSSQSHSSSSYAGSRHPPDVSMRNEANPNGQAILPNLNHNGTHVPNPEKPKSIAKVNFVSDGSPADSAGIKVDDEIVEFGSVNASNIKGLGSIGEVVQSSVNRPIVVKIIRGTSEQTVELSLTPRTWSGRGLLGCNIIPTEYTN